MKIISNFKDYYDGAAFSFGQDPIYFRTYNQFRINYPDRFLRKVHKYNEWADFSLDRHLVVLGYKPVIVTEHRYRKPIRESKLWVPYEYTYSYEYNENISEYFKMVLECVKETAKDSIDLNKIPIWVVSGIYTLSINPILKNRPLMFQKHLDAYQTAQEIDMFLSNLAEPVASIPVVSDKIKIESHGFDFKNSFRKGKKDAKQHN